MIQIVNDIYLTRLIDNGKLTLGFMVLFDRISTISFNTLELPWLNNRVGESCIPPGVYKWEKYMSPARGYEVILIKDVPGRSFIEIHPANYVKQLKGCIAPGLSFADINNDGEMDVKKSRMAFDIIIKKTDVNGRIFITEPQYAKK